MTNYMYSASVPVFKQMLGALNNILAKRKLTLRKRRSSQTRTCRRACLRTCFR